MVTKQIRIMNSLSIPLPQETDREEDTDEDDYKITFI